ncbi:MAG: phosphate--acyl-ACP acyltransferase [Phototrophicales bacterium]|nr:MAG: phosphate--acyl-ACP acyltransferase [Phototrophicales bacterium]
MHMRIALDVMGSDHNPVPDIAGAVAAAREFADTTILLVGDERLIHDELKKHEHTGLKLEIIPAPEAVTMTDKPSVVGKAKPNSSMHIGMNLVKAGQADGFVTAGNTGAVLSIATLFTLRRIPGVKRPALTAMFGFANTTLIVLDVGANADCKPDWLAQFALMGNIYAKSALPSPSPRIGILSNGEEEGKGNDLIRAASDLIRELPLNFVGNIEPKQMLSGEADVIVADGFVGNILIKSMEAATKKMAETLRTELTSTVLSTLGAALSRSAFKRVQRQVDPAEVGGAPLLGVNGVVIIGHGSSNAKAIKNAIGQARKAASANLVETIRSELERTGSIAGMERD